jgi:hypothetical protein
MGTMIIINATFVRQSPVNNSQAVDIRICPTGRVIIHLSNP